MKTHTEAAITLTLLVPILTEVLTSNTPILRFLKPQYLILLTIAYIPVLIIREVSLRLKLNLTGVAMLGIAYGIYNEGVCAQTLLLKSGVPIPTFDHYGLFLGINFSWTAVIILWHILHSVLYPISIVHFLYPEVRSQTWLSKKTTALLLVLIALVGTFLFFNVHKYHALYFLIFIVLIISLFFIARLFIATSKEPDTGGVFSFKPVIFGFISILFFICSFFLSALKIPLTQFYLYYFGELFLIIFFLKRKGWFEFPGFLLFGIGSYMAYALFSIGGVSASRQLLLVTAITLEVFFVALILKIGRRIRLRTLNNNVNK